MNIGPAEVDEQFDSYDDCMKFNAILDMKETFTLYESGIHVIENPAKKGSGK